MCGLAGIHHPAGDLSRDQITDLIAAMTGPITHRGPDAGGLWVDPAAQIGLGHRRLSIIDLSAAGAQPMVSADGRWVIAYNGEIYNTAQIRSALAPVAYRGHSDTEVLVEAISQWGVERTLRAINAMFAVAIWDTERRELWLARDRFGEKPLYYGRAADGAVVFGSELKALRAYPGLAAEINRDALVSLLRYAMIPAPQTILAGVRKLPAGSYLRVIASGEITEPVRYWDPVTEAGLVTRREVRGEAAVDELEEILTRVVRDRMVSDVPLGAFLSGGVDSSTVVALMQKVSDRPVKTFTIGFQESGYDESPHARAVATHLGTDHTELMLTAADAQAVIQRLAQIYDEPFADSSQIPTCLVSALAAEHVTVALSGDGGDELFGGYDRYRVLAQLDRLKGRIPGPLMRSAGSVLQGISVERWDRLLAGPFGRVAPGLAQRRPGHKAHKLGRLLQAPSGQAYESLRSENHLAEGLVLGASGGGVRPYLLSDESGSRSVFEQAMLADTLTYMPDDILTKLDRASMAVSLEVRVPLLDPEVFGFAWGLDHRDRVRDGVGKWPLRQLLKRYVPAAIVERPKMGFGVPIGAWLRGDLREWAEELLNESLIREQGYLDAVQVRRLWEQHLSGSGDYTYELWPLLMWQAWLAEWGL